MPLTADALTVTGGSVLAQAEASPLAIDAAVSVTGGSLAVSGHTGNYTEEDAACFGAEACKSVSGSVEFSAFLPFSDVFAADSYFDAVAWCYDNGLFKGVAEDRFAPDSSMTRAMFVTVLYRLAGQPAVETETPFTDLTQDWYRSAVAWAVAQEITRGTSETSFSPNSPVTREQAAVFLRRYARSMGELERLSARKDSGSHGSFSSWAEADGLWALEAGLFDGVRFAMAEPGSPAPRSLLASVLFNYRHFAQ